MGYYEREVESCVEGIAGMTAFLYAGLSLLCAAVNDMIFKAYAGRRQALGTYLAVVGLLWAGFFVMMAGPGRFLAMSGVTLFWGLASGLCSAVANLLLIQALSRHEVGVCSTIYRLNLAPAAILAFVFLGEPVSAPKLLGVLAAVGAVLLFAHRTKGAANHLGLRALWLVVAACLLRAGMGIGYKCGLNQGGEMFPILVLNGMVWVLCGALCHWSFERGKRVLTADALGFGAVSGVFVCGIVMFMMLALRSGDASVVLPLSQMSFVATALAGCLLLGEKLTRRKSAGLAMAVLCVIFMALERW